MNDQHLSQQLTLFGPQLPSWQSIPSDTQQLILDAMAELMIQSIAPEIPQTTQSKANTQHDS